MTDERVAVSVVVPAHDATTTIDDQLAALASQQDAPEFEVIVVCNLCSDGTYVRALSWTGRVPRLQVIERDAMASASYARNEGAALARGEILLFCDADDRVDVRWVTEMAAVADRCDVWGGRLVPMPGAPQWIARGFAPQQQEDLPLSLGQSVRFVISASLGMTHDAFTRIGGFDTSYSNGEDVVLSLRAQGAGLRMGIVPSAITAYRLRPTFRDLLRQQRGYGRAAGRLRAEVQPDLMEGGVVDAAKAIAGFHHILGTRTIGDAASRTVRQISALETARSFRGTSEGNESLPNYVARWLTHRFPETSGRLGLKPRHRTVRRDTLMNFTTPLSLPVIGGLGFVANSRLAPILARQPYEPLTLEFMAEHIGVGSTVIDVGANIGLVTVAAALLIGDTGRVISFEPASVSLLALRENVRRHAREPVVEIFPQAVSDATFRGAVRDDHRYGLTTHLVEPDEGTELVDVVRLDDLDVGDVALLKVDVEGHDLRVLRGALALLERTASVIVELNPGTLIEQGCDPVDLVDFVGSRFPHLAVLEVDHRSPFFGTRRAARDVREWLTRRENDATWYANLAAWR